MSKDLYLSVMGIARHAEKYAGKKPKRIVVEFENESDAFECEAGAQMESDLTSGVEVNTLTREISVHGVPMVFAGSPEIRADGEVRSFAEYCRHYRTMRFWQALSNWSGYNFILVSELPVESDPERGLRDTYYLERARK